MCLGGTSSCWSPRGRIKYPQFYQNINSRLRFLHVHIIWVLSKNIYIGDDITYFLIIEHIYALKYQSYEVTQVRINWEARNVWILKCCEVNKYELPPELKCSLIMDKYIHLILLLNMNNYKITDKSIKRLIIISVLSWEK